LGWEAADGLRAKIISTMELYFIGESNKLGS
jgi:hypothetical protein